MTTVCFQLLGAARNSRVEEKRKVSPQRHEETKKRRKADLLRILSDLGILCVLVSLWLHFSSGSLLLFAIHGVECIATKE